VVRDDVGRFIVADRLADEVRVFDSTGGFRYRFGRAGPGPREFRGPASPVLGKDRVLWIRDTGNGRLVSYRLGTDAADFLRTVPSVTGGAVLPFPIGLHPSGALIELRNRLDFSAGHLVYTRHVVDSTGRQLSAQEIRPPPDRVPSTSVSSGTRNQTGGVFFPLFGPRHLVALADRGDFAEAISSTYAVRWYDPDGRLKLTVVRDAGPGPLLTDAERDAALANARLITERTGRAQPADPPERKPVLSELLFDREGHLWVVRSGTRGEPTRADVYDSAGARIAAVEWPASVVVTLGEVGLDQLVGVTTMVSGGDRIVVVGWSAVTRTSERVSPP
jgi:hypothetical protein